ncbi:hypothetical protein JB92DRAFT_2831021 [Gautieria morchelliformis]|nr:hypothetical protein JB92DRAFT_2831021 [Gautieria morchelliformis]
MQCLMRMLDPASSIRAPGPWHHDDRTRTPRPAHVLCTSLNPKPQASSIPRFLDTSITPTHLSHTHTHPTPRRILLLLLVPLHRHQRRERVRVIARLFVRRGLLVLMEGYACDEGAACDGGGGSMCPYRYSGWSACACALPLPLGASGCAASGGGRGVGCWFTNARFVYLPARRRGVAFGAEAAAAAR